MVYRLRFLSRKTWFFDCFLSEFLDVDFFDVEKLDCLNRFFSCCFSDFFDVDFFDVEKLDCLNRCFSCFLSDFFRCCFLYLKIIVVFSLFFLCEFVCFLSVQWFCWCFSDCVFLYFFGCCFCSLGVCETFFGIFRLFRTHFE